MFGIAAVILLEVFIIIIIIWKKEVFLLGAHKLASMVIKKYIYLITRYQINQNL